MPKAKAANLIKAPMKLTKRQEKIANAIHDWYTDRWNDYYSQSNEPGWSISDDIAKLLSKVCAISPTVTNVKQALKEILDETPTIHID